MAKRILMIAYHYPPLQGSSGVQRTLKFSKYLPEFGWEPIILTANARAYQNISADQLNDIPEKMLIYRAFALDASKHLSFMKRYPGILALPDRWVSWWLGAVPLGIYLVKKYKPDIIWSTYPIATAHLIGFTLNLKTGIPWIADFRDPMTEIDYPLSDPMVRRAFQWIEKKTVARCARAVFTTQGTCNEYKKRFPKVPDSLFSLIENGYDEENFAMTEDTVANNNLTNRPFVLVHSGIIYPFERNPKPLFEALSDLYNQKKLTANNFNLILRASHHEKYLNQLIDKYGIESIVTIASSIPYQEALNEMLAADGLLILQASNCNNQIPAKLYEYLRARRPILALTDPIGDTARKLREFGINTIARLDSKVDIMQNLIQFIELAKKNNIQIAPIEKILTNSRKSKTKELASLLDNVVGTAAKETTVPNVPNL